VVGRKKGTGGKSDLRRDQGQGESQYREGIKEWRNCSPWGMSKIGYDRVKERSVKRILENDAERRSSPASQLRLGKREVGKIRKIIHASKLTPGALKRLSTIQIEAAVRAGDIALSGYK